MVSASTVLLVLIALASIGYILSLLLEIADDFKALVHTGLFTNAPHLLTSVIVVRDRLPGLMLLKQYVNG